MLLLHISDIHFRKDDIWTAMDPNFHLRNELLSDAGKQCDTLGAPDAILLSGDVAFGGHREEYVFALNWLTSLCDRCGISVSNVFVCPGNHDVLRQITSRPAIRALHRTLKEATSTSIDPTVKGHLSDPEAGRMLYESIESYNLFAVQFFCDLIPPNRTLAHRVLTLNDGSLLNVWGLNSTFVSSAADARGDLIVDPAYNQISRQPGTEHLVMCHHPYEWLRNGAALRDHLNDVARIQLFGHDHTSRIELGRDHIRVAAGAVHPDRTEYGWEPGYNLIDLAVRGSGGDRHLDVNVHVRIWQAGPGRFHAKHDRNSPTFSQSIRLEGWNPLVIDRATKTASNQELADLLPIRDVNVELGNDPMNSVRDISVRFFRLTLSQRSAIAGKLSLLEEEDVNQPDFERFRRVLVRAKERGLVAKLEQELRVFENPSTTS